MPRETNPSDQFFPKELKFKDFKPSGRKVKKKKVDTTQAVPETHFMKDGNPVNSSNKLLGQEKPALDPIDASSRPTSDKGFKVDLDYDEHSGSVLGKDKV